MIKFLRLLKGYIIFCAEGGFPERFINLCRIKGVSLWNVKNDGVKVRAFTTEKEYELVKNAAENSGMALKIEKKCGLKFFAINHKWRCGALFGVFMAVFFWAVMSGFIWEVEILEVEGVNVENFTETLSEFGVKPGARKAKIDIQDVQNKLMNEYKELLWVSVNIFGTKAQVEMSVAVNEKSEADDKLPKNIVAKKDGTVTLVKGYFGENVVKEGDTVVQGQLLISGVTVNADGSENFVEAGGEVLAKTVTVSEVTQSLKETVKITTDSQERFNIYLFGLKIPLGKKPKGDFESESRIFWQSEESTLPLGVFRDENLSFYETTAKLSEKEAMLSALLESVTEKRTEFRDAETEKAAYSFKGEKNAVTVTSKIECVEDIAKESPIEFEE